MINIEKHIKELDNLEIELLKQIEEEVKIIRLIIYGECTNTPLGKILKATVKIIDKHNK